MSYSIWLNIDTGGHDAATVGEYWNYTSNCAPMWRAAGVDLAEFHGKPAGGCIAPLERALANMRDTPRKFTSMNPANGWGSFETLVPKLEHLRDNFAAHPKATVVVWR